MTWLSLARATAARASLLPESYRLRFLPAGNWNGEAALHFRAWDLTSGAAGGVADLSRPQAVGGATAFSAEVDLLFAVITPGNDRPTLDVGGEPRTTPVAAGEAEPAGDTVAGLLGSALTDPDAASRQGIAVLAAPAQAGRWEYRLAGTADWRPVGTVSNDGGAAAAVGGRGPVRAAGRLHRVRPAVVPRLGPDGGCGRDQGADPRREHGLRHRRRVGHVHRRWAAAAGQQRPGAGRRAGGRVHAHPGGPVHVARRRRRGAARGADRPRSGCPAWHRRHRPVRGDGRLVAVLAQRRPDLAPGSAALSPSSALLLRDTDRLRFVPTANFNGTVGLTFRGWDRTRGRPAVGRTWARRGRPAGRRRSARRRRRPASPSSR